MCIRYKYLFDYISTNFCNNILEIGTNQGKTAKKLIELSLNNQVNYYGIDLFQELYSYEISLQEMSIQPSSISDVKDLINNKNSILLQGFSKDIFNTYFKNNSIKFDMIIVDGGHSYSTVKLDTEFSLSRINPSKSIFIDDYTDEPTYPENNPNKYGVKQYIDELINLNKYNIIIHNEDKDNYRGYDYRMVEIKC